MPAPALASRAARWAFTAAAVATFLAVTMGSVVCATDSSAACPNWPGCYVGGVLPKGHVNPLIEFVHRVAAVSTGPLVLATGVIGLRAGRGFAQRVLPWISLACALAAGVFGMMVILFTLPMPLGVLDLVCSLVALIGTTVSAAAAWRGTPGTLPAAARTGAYAVGGLLLLHATGVIIAGKGSYTRCMGWPLPRMVPADTAWMQPARGVLAVSVLALLAIMGAQARQHSRRLVAVAAAPLALAVLEIVLGLTMLDTSSLLSKSVYSVVAVLVLFSTSLAAALVATGADRPSGDLAAA